MHRLRLLTLSLITVWVSAPSLRAATVYYTESAVTLQLTIRKTGQLSETGPDAEGVVVRETRIESSRLGNAEILAEMKQRGLIPAVNGYSLVAVWANWPDEAPFRGSAFRLFVRKVGAKAPALSRVPQDVFAITPEDWLHERDLLRKSGAITSGTEKFEACSQLKLEAGAVSGTLLGSDIGGGVFKAPAKSRKPQYLPTAGSMSLEGTAGDGIASGQVTFGPARFISKADFKPAALPKNTAPGGYYGSSISAMMMMDRLAWGAWYVPPHVHHFCPLSVEITLKRQETVSSAQKGREVTRITTSTLPAAELLRGALQARGITDADTAGWSLYLHARSDQYLSFENFDLVAGHADGRIVALGNDELDLSATRAEEARREYREGVYLAGVIRELAHVTHRRAWPLENGKDLSLLVTGAGEIESRYGAIPAVESRSEIQPVAATFRLFGSYAKYGENGLASVTFTVGAPLAQPDIPAGWATVFPAYSAPVWHLYSSSAPTSSWAASYATSVARAAQEAIQRPLNRADHDALLARYAELALPVSDGAESPTVP